MLSFSSLNNCFVDHPFKTLHKSTNIFNNLPDLAPAFSDHCDKLDYYLASDVENVTDVLMWWYKRQATFPHLLCMACDYLPIPGGFSFYSSFVDTNTPGSYYC